MVQTSRWPVSHITPFTYRDGETYLSLLNRLAEYITTQLHPNLRQTVEEMVEKMEHILADQHQLYVRGIQDFQRIHDAFMTDVNSALMALNDNAVSDLAEDPGSVFGSTLRELINQQVIGDGDIMDYFDTRYPSLSNSLNYWVHPTGSDTTGDGTETHPFATITHAISLAQTVTLRDGASVNIRLFPVDYNEQVRVSTETSQKLTIRVYGYDVGGHPRVPLTRFRNVSGSVFWSHNPGIIWRLYDIKFLDCGTGMNVVNGMVFTTNVHAENCTNGVSSTRGALDVKGGIFTNNNRGVYSFMLNRHSIGRQHAGSTDEGPWFYNNTTGVQIQEGSTGHVDYCLFEGNESGIGLSRSGHVNPDGSVFRRNGIDFRASAASTITAGNRVTFGHGDDASDRLVRMTGGSQFSGNYAWSSIAPGRHIEEKLIRHITEETSYSDDVSNIYRVTLEPDWWNDVRDASYPTKAFVVRMWGELTGPTSTGKRFSISLGGNPNAFLLVPPGTNSEFMLEVDISFRDRGEQVVKTTLVVDQENPRVAVRRWNVDMSEPQTLLIAGQKPNIGEGSWIIHEEQTWFRGV